jgi:hypothetical protein
MIEFIAPASRLQSLLTNERSLAYLRTADKFKLQHLIHCCGFFEELIDMEKYMYELK